MGIPDFHVHCASLTMAITPQPPEAAVCLPLRYIKSMLAGSSKEEQPSRI